MRRFVAPVLVVAATARVAHADAKADIQKAVDNAVQSIGFPDNKAFGTAWADGAWRVISVPMNDGRPYFGIDTTRLVEKLHAVSIGVDEASGTAWFHGVVDATYLHVADHGRGEVGDDRPRSFHDVLHVSGLAVNDHGWKVAALLWSPTVADSLLLAGGADSPPPPGLATAGDATIDKEISPWITGGLGAHRAPGAAAVNGTAPTELGTGAAVPALVASWDKLALTVQAIEARTFARGKVGFAVADVTMKTRKGQYVGMRLALTLVPDGGHWTWTTLNFSTPPEAGF